MYNIFELLHDSQEEGGGPTSDISEAFPQTGKQRLWERGGVCAVQGGLWGPLARQVWALKRNSVWCLGPAQVFICFPKVIHLVLLGTCNFLSLSSVHCCNKGFGGHRGHPAQAALLCPWRQQACLARQSQHTYDMSRGSEG